MDIIPYQPMNESELKPFRTIVSNTFYDLKTSPSVREARRLVQQLGNQVQRRTSDLGTNLLSNDIIAALRRVPEEGRLFTEKDTIIDEREAWREVLGVEVDVPRFPAEITPAVRNKIKKLGLGLHYMPQIDFGTEDFFRNTSDKKYIQYLYEKYPNWHPFESLNSTELKDPTIPRMAKEDFWFLVRDHQVDFPKMDGYWVIAETMPKSEYGKPYLKENSLTKVLQNPYRRYESYNNVQHELTKRIARKHGRNNTWVVKHTLGLPEKSTLRIPTFLEANLLGNRFKWGGTSTWELSSTLRTIHNITEVLVWGEVYRGGVGDFGYQGLSKADPMVGWRLLIEV